MNPVRPARLALALPALLWLAGMVMIGWWLTGVKGGAERPRFAGEDGAPEQAAGSLKVEREVLRNEVRGATLTPGAALPETTSASWPQFRGADRSNVARTSVPLARSWPAAGPRRLWSVTLGQGHAGAAVSAGSVYILDYDEAAQADTLRALDLATGKERWAYRSPVPIKRNHGISRTVPAVNAELVIGITPTCQVLCLERETGAFRWRLDLPAQYGTKVPGWYTGQCPLLIDGVLYLAPSGPEVLALAIEAASGRILWSAPNPHASAMSHASLMPGADGTLLYPGTRGVVAIDRLTGRLRWDSTRFAWHTIAPSPLALPNGRVLLTAGYGCEAMLLDPKAPEPILTTPPRRFGAEQHTPILYQDHLYAVLPKPRQELVCTDLALTELWASGVEHRFGLGPYLLIEDPAGALLVAMDDAGELSLIEATPEAFRPLARAKVLPGPDAWGPMALVDDKLILRDLTEMICLTLTGDGE